MQDAGCWILVAEYSLSFFVCRSLFVVCCLFVEATPTAVQRTPLAVANDFNREAIGSVNRRRKAN